MTALANAGTGFVILDDWDARGKQKGQDVRTIALHIMAEGAKQLQDGAAFVVAPPPIQGIGNAAGVTMQIELRDSSFDLNKLQNTITSLENNARSQSSIQRVMAPFRSSVPQYTIEFDRQKTENLRLTTD